MTKRKKRSRQKKVRRKMDLPTGSVAGNSEAAMASASLETIAAPELEEEPLKVPLVNQCEPGPWGKLEYYDTFLEAPDDLIESFPLPSQNTVWNFENATEERLTDLFSNVRLNEAQRSTLLDRRLWVSMPNGIRVFPPAEIVEGLSPVSRGAIYRILGLSELNPFHRHPFLFDRPDLNTALDRSGLPESLIQALSGLTFRVGKNLQFCDFPHFLRYLRHPLDERRFLRILTRSRSLILRLNLDGDNDLKAIRDYWASKAQLVQTMPLIESVVASKGVDTLDLVHLLPPAPRSQIFTFPSRDDCLSGRAPDSVWTALNFFNQEAISIYAESPNLESLLKSGYRAVEGSCLYGDVIFVKNANDMGVGTACVYIAADIVYVKNSASLLAPWVFSTMEDMINRHAGGTNIEMRVWRRK